MGRRRKFHLDEVYSLLRWLTESHGFPPTVEELRGAMGVRSTRTVVRYLRWLEEDGLIRRLPGARGIRIRGACPACGRPWKKGQK